MHIYMLGNISKNGYISKITTVCLTEYKHKTMWQSCLIATSFTSKIVVYMVLIN